MHRRTPFVVALFAALVLPLFAVAQSSESSSSSATSTSSADTSSVSSAVTAGFGTISIEQLSANGAIGNWTLLPANGGEKIESTSQIKSLTNIPSGLYTLFVEPPSGAVTSVRVYDGDTLQKYASVPQASFTVSAGSAIKITVNFQFTKTGSISVTSDPYGIEFVLTGPNGIVLKGITPQSYESQPEGQYKVDFQPPEGCGTPPAKGDLLKPAGRISFVMKFACKAADAMRTRQETNGGTGENVVTVTVNGKSFALSDVPKSAWFSTFVANVTKSGIMGGYKDAEGNPTGLFGPENPVTIAELSKIAHAIAGLSDTAGHQPVNPGAQEGWFSGTIASAEDRGWIVYDDGTVDPLRPATRAEVLVTLLQALDVPLRWQKGTFFTDVTVHTQFAAAIETAAHEGLVSGKDGENGLKTFGPGDAINRAELSKILSITAQKFRQSASSSSNR